jgi:endogenous inhibitor of DNA gyrase (YacG/DUF329 family)
MVEIPADRCDRCGEAFHQPATGRRRRYCSDSCKQLAYQLRRAERLLAKGPPADSVNDETRWSA